MKRFRRAIAMVVTAVCLSLFGACRLTPIDARTIEEIQGTYSLVEYNSCIGSSEQNLISSFDFFYIIMSNNGVAHIVYQNAGEDTPFVGTENYTLKYMSGSTELIDEIKLRFDMPHSTLEGGMKVNYFTVSPNNTLFCQKIDYLSESNNAKDNRHVVHMTLKYVSSEKDFSYVEGKTGLSLQ